MSQNAKECIHICESHQHRTFFTTFLKKVLQPFCPGMKHVEEGAFGIFEDEASGIRQKFLNELVYGSSPSQIKYISYVLHCLSDEIKTLEKAVTSSQPEVQQVLLN